MKTVLCHGKFDILHAGHLFYLSEAKALGDRLVVSLTADDYLKEPAHFNQDERKRALDLIGFVDEVKIVHDPTGVPAILTIRPDIYVKGSDYLDSKDPILEKEKNAVERIGGKLVIIEPDIKFSSTKIKHINSPYLDLSSENFNIQYVVDFIIAVKNIKVNVIGETIIDAFQTVELDGQSAKSSCPSFAILEGGYTEQIGGAGVIARHLENFCDVCLITNNTLIKKLRYIDRFRNKKHFEVKTIQINGHQDFLHYKSREMTIIADFGHSLLDGSENFGNSDYYIMAQTNSSNYGYNLIDKWNEIRAKLVCIDRVEGSLLLGKKFEHADKELMKELLGALNTESIILTMHKYGSVYYNGTEFETVPGLATNVVDTIGAGDAFFTFASLAHFAKFSPKYILLIGSIAAAISTQWLCNENAITPEELLKTAKIII